MVIMEIKAEEKLKEKILNTLDPILLTKPFICRGKDMLFKNYLLEEVFPYIDLISETVSLKEGYVLSLKEFLEQEKNSLEQILKNLLEETSEKARKRTDQLKQKLTWIQTAQAAIEFGEQDKNERRKAEIEGE